MKTTIVPILLCVFTLFGNIPAKGQTRWSAWQTVKGNSTLQYRLAFARTNEEKDKSGYYVEVKNEADQRVWFSLYLSPSAQADRNDGKITLKPGTRSVVGLFWASTLQEGFPDAQFDHIRFEPVSDLMTTVAGPK